MCPLTVAISICILSLQHAKHVGHIQISLTQVKTTEQKHNLQGVKQIRIHPQSLPQPNSYSFKPWIIQDVWDTNTSTHETRGTYELPLRPDGWGNSALFSTSSFPPRTITSQMARCGIQSCNTPLPQYKSSHQQSLSRLPSITSCLKRDILCDFSLFLWWASASMWWNIHKISPPLGTGCPPQLAVTAMISFI